MSTKITKVIAREILDSRGRPTVEAEVYTDGGYSGRASVPSGASTGKHEAIELRDQDKTRYDGRGVRNAVQNIREIAGILIGQSVLDQRALDEILIKADGTPNKSRLGANATLAVSLATARAAAAAEGISLWKWISKEGPTPLPMPMVNIVSGGLHAARNLDFQDFLMIPVGATSYSEALHMCIRVHAATAAVLKSRGMTSLKADEGGYGPPLANNREALDLLMEAFSNAGFKPGEDVAIALDVASTHFYDIHDNRYRLRSDDQALDAAGMTSLLAEWVRHYPIVSIEDGLTEDDWEGWKHLTTQLGQSIQVIGDDLFTTNPVRLKRGIDIGVANSILVKMNQIGTLTETLDVVKMAKEAGYRTIISARSGETEDSFLADLAVGCAGGQIKIGSVFCSERLSKYNQLLRIEEELGKQAQFANPFKTTAA